jgi:N-glycosylase/DNA lyase
MSSKLVRKVESLKPLIGRVVEKRIDEFLSMREKGNYAWFSELCFCILTANSSAEIGIKIQDALGYEGFANLSEESLATKLREAGYRFYNVRAKYIVEARRYLRIKDILEEVEEKREWLVKNVKGIGYKEASHFLRNVGFLDYAILDRHILRIMHNSGIIEMPKNLSRKRYLEIEKRFINLASKLEMRPGELDLYLWYLSTGKVMK